MQDKTRADAFFYPRKNCLQTAMPLIFLKNNGNFCKQHAHSATSDDLKELFAPFCAVEKIKMLKDKFSGKPRGLAFVEIGEGAAAKNIVESLNGREMGGRELKVDFARSRTEKRPFNGFRAKKTFGKPRGKSE